MKKESLELLRLGVTMVGLGAMCILVTYAVLLGKDVGERSVASFQRIEADTEIGALKELAGADRALPAAAVLALMQYNRAAVGQVTCYVCDPERGLVQDASASPCVMRHLKGDLILRVRPNEGDGIYDLTAWPPGMERGEDG